MDRRWCFISSVLLHVFTLFLATEGLSPSGINVVGSQQSRRERYKSKCGLFDWDRCTRHRTVYYTQYDCRTGYRSTDSYGCPWAICDGDINPTEACNIDYDESHIIYSNGQVQYSSGGTCSLPDQCTNCREGFYASPSRCQMCSPITNCDLEACTSPTNQVCARCEGVVLEEKGHRAYARTANKKACIQACSWREDSTSCYPGTCSMEYASSCKCMDEFSGPHCQTIDTVPTIMYNMLKLRGPGLDVKEAPETPNEGSPQEDSWTNINDSRIIQYKFTSAFVPKSTLPTSHVYIEGYAVGIVDGYVTFSILREGTQIKALTRPCGGASVSSPHQDVFTCVDEVSAEDILDFPVQSGDIIEFSFVTKNGGHVKIRNKEKTTLKTAYYSGKTRMNTFRLGIDFIDPYHCSAQNISTCKENMISVTKTSISAPIPVEWRGWEDDVAVDYCKLSLFDLIDRNIADDNSRLHVKTQVSSKDIYSPQITYDMPVTTPGAYSLELTAYDKAGNHKSARRIFIYDGTSKVETVHNTELLVTSAAQVAEYLWQWTDDSVYVDWQNRYINSLHDRNKWLKAVVGIADVEPDYDDNDFSRGINAIPNIQAIVEYRTNFLVDHSGGSTITHPQPDSDFRSQNLSQHQTVSPDLVDGDTLRFWIRAYDVRHEFLEENVTVHIDTSPPVIENMWLTREDRLNISVHNIEDFNMMTFEWLSYDVHSGLETVSWRLFDNFTGEDILHGLDHLSPQGDTLSLSECQQNNGEHARGANCYCTPGMGCYHRHYQVKPRVIASNLTHGGVFHDKHRGVHDSDYFLEVTVMNHAKLYTKLDFQITIDASPSHPGVVHDGQAGQPEVDYQDSQEIHAHWDGFFDSESGVKFYQYGFADHCLSETDFGLTLKNFNVTETYSTQASWIIPRPGKYYITVVAYNRALEPSRPVCSDGVTVDQTPPALSQIAVTNSRVVPGLVSTPPGEVWYIDRYRRRSQVLVADEACRLKGTILDNTVLQLFPLQHYHNGTLISHRSAFCNSSKPFPRSFINMFYISKENQLSVNWTGSDSESGIYDYEVGLMSDPSDEAAPDILPFTSTHHHPQYQAYHPGLSEGEQFYIGVKATNNAGLSVTKSLGPVIVHTTPPVFTGTINVSLKDDHLVAQWTAGSFTDSEPNHLTYKVSVGTKYMTSVIIPFGNILSGGGCTLTSPPTCTAVAIRDLHWDLHHSHTYYVSVRVINIVGLSTVAVSEPYIHDIRKPSRGVVIDVCPEQELNEFDVTALDESDHQTLTESLKVRWYGFDDGVLNVSYKAGIELDPGSVNIRAFEDVEYGLEHEFKRLLLIPSQKYFVTVVATSVGGQVTVSSDGVNIIQHNVNIKDVVVYDGLGCQETDVHNWNPEHYDKVPGIRCERDLVYQKSTSMISAHWNLTEDYRRQYPDVYWRLERKMSQSDDIWDAETNYESLGSSNHLVSRAALDAGYTYRVAVKLCAVRVCSMPISSDGVTILHRSPVAGTMNVTYKEKAVGAEITIAMGRFYDPDVPVKEEAYVMIDMYEWCLTDNTHSTKTFTKWTSNDMETQALDANQMLIMIKLPSHLDFSKCRRVAIKGYNKLGLYTIISADIINCKAYEPALVVSSVVIDATGSEITKEIGTPISLTQNEGWYIADADYTPYKNILSAVWPTLRHRNYSWAVVSGDKVDPTSYYKRENIMTVSDPCIMPDVIKCGRTDKEFINIDMSTSLHHGSRYYICIHADPTTVEYEKWTEDLPEVHSCSDGITVDLTPPVGGRVYIGGLLGQKYQISRTELDVYWDGFTDVEEGGLASHSSGISHYEVELGTISGGRDIMKDRNAGLVNHLTVNELMLHDGHVVYASVKAIDHTNQSTLVVSGGILIDSSPPTKTGRQIIVSERYITKPALEACWDGVLVDSESGIARYEVSLGSRPAYDDLIPYVSSQEKCMNIDITDFAEDGQIFFVSIKGYNNAGLRTLVTSRPLVVDTTAPSVGHVYDGQQTQMKDGLKDHDFVTKISDMGAYWEGFTDPHSSISHYLFKVGTCPGCDDTLSEQNIGARQDVIFSDIVFVPGIRYYVEITACNMAGLCSKGSSDGIILDPTPPAAGHVMDGTQDMDIQFQSSRTFLGCKWRGFYDPESDLDHYEWRVGTTPGGDEILTKRSVALEEITFHTLPRDQQLPIGQRLYISIKAYNKAGMFTEVSSNGFVIDDTPPVVVTAPRHVNDLGTTSTTFSRTTLHITWEFTDDVSFIETHYISLSSHQLGEFNSSLIKVPGLLREYTYSQLELQDGSFYKVKITACNMADLCTTSSSGDILLDNSAPTTGTFAVQTDHAARLSRHQTGWMTWTDTSLRLAWLGFTDLHSGVDHFIVTVGSEQFASDLNKNNQHLVLSPTQSGIKHGDEGFVETFVFDTQDISSRFSVFVAIWAVNGVGLHSTALHSELTLVAGGGLDLVRRCQPYNCEGHCVCAVQDGACSSSTDCSELDYGVASVSDITGLHLSADNDEDYSCFDTYMAASWSTDVYGQIVKHYEISIGDSDENYPEGVYDSATERVWFDVGQQTSAVISLPTGKKLIQGHNYSFYIRAWDSDTSFSVSKSDGVMIDKLNPQATRIGGYAVKEHSESGQVKDVDFQSSTDNIIISWTNLFLHGHSEILKYRVYISTTLGGHSIHESGDLTTTSYTATSLSLEPDTVYYSSVLAYNTAGLVSWAYSDGVQVDDVPPVAGRVHDGHDIHDIDYQSLATSIGASWYGFSDSDSALLKYYWCVGITSDTIDCSILDWQDSGLHTSVSKTIHAVESGSTVWNKVYAVDVVGHVSPVAVSNGVVIDISPPEPQNVAYIGTNIIQNPSFEVRRHIKINNMCSSPQPKDWDLVDDSCADIITSTGGTARDGQSHIILSGSIHQKMSDLTPGQMYRVILHTGYPERVHNEHKVVEGFVAVDNERFIFSLDPHLCKGICRIENPPIILWNTHTFSFTATSQTTDIAIGTASQTMKMVVDHISLQTVDYEDKGTGSQTENHMVFHTMFLVHWSSLHVSWHFKDDQSPITEYQWAVGFVKGGTQLLDFMSVGRNTQGTLSGLRLFHMSKLYVTIMAANAAGLTTVTYSNLVQVDMTPPVIEHIHDGLGDDTDFIAAEKMSVSWLVADEESEVAYCDWAIGHTEGQHDIKSFERASSGQSFAKYDLSEIVTSSSMKVYSTIRCFNKVGLASAASSDGVEVVASSDNVSVSELEILEERSNVFWERGQCHGDQATLRLKWDGRLADNLQSTKVRTEWAKAVYEHDVPTLFPYGVCKLSGLKFDHLTEFNVSVRYVDFLGPYGKQSTITAQTHGMPPALQRNVKIVSQSAEGEITLSWNGLFTSPWSDLVYEIEIGRVLGGADIVERHLTRADHMELTLAPVHRTVKVLYVSVTAVDPCGYTSHYSQIVEIEMNAN